MTVIRLFRSIQITLFNAQPTLLTNTFFNSSALKARIKMLVNPKTNRQALWGYALVLPVSAVLLMCSQKDPVQTEPLANAKKEAVPSNSLAKDSEIFTIVEHNPEPQGGMEGLSNFINQNLRYPGAAQKAQVEGKVFVSFVVTSEGKIRDILILKGIGFGCDAEAVRVVSQMPNWKPGLQSGHPVNVRFNLPITFALEKNSADASSKTETDFLAKYTLFTVDGKSVDKQTFMKAYSENPRGISSDPSNNRIGITTR